MASSKFNKVYFLIATFFNRQFYLLTYFFKQDLRSHSAYRFTQFQNKLPIQHMEGVYAQ